MPEANEILGTTIITARAARRWTQEDLAAKLGVARQAVARWENGNQPSDANLAKLREILGPDVWKVPEHPPQRIAPTDVRGARYAAVLMTETVATILRECARVEDLAEQAELAAKAAATHRAAPPANAKGSGTPARRPRRAQG